MDSSAPPTAPDHPPVPANPAPAPSSTSGPTPGASSSSAGTQDKGKGRDLRVWLPSNDARPPPLPDLPDSYFAPTASEAQKAFSGQQAARERLNDAPMLTKALRDREEKAKKEARYKKYPLGRMRVRFADRMMLEGTFPSTATIRDIYDFVGLHLAVPEADFVLYQTPPKREFKVSDPKVNASTLLDLQLAPAALFHNATRERKTGRKETRRTPDAGLEPLGHLRLFGAGRADGVASRCRVVGDHLGSKALRRRERSGEGADGGV